MNNIQTHSARCTPGVQLALVFAGLVASACGPGGPSRDLPADAPAHVRTAVSECLGIQRPEKTSCYEPLILARLSSHGVADALSMLETIAIADEGVQRDGHVYTHLIGIEGFAMNPDMPEVFPQCSTLFQSGCYHGVIQAHFMAKGSIEASDVATLCEAYKGEGAARWILFQCLHGLGHGLTMFYGHSLPRALESCDHLEASWDRRACHGGAFMENVLNATAPHHPASELAAGAADTGHSHEPETAEMAMAPAPANHETDHEADRETADEPYMTASGWKALDPEDPLYPCSAVDSGYWNQCYMMQTSVMLHLNGGDIKAAAQSCTLAPEEMRETCFRSLGRDISSYTLQDHRKSIRQCNHSPQEYRAFCYVGLVKNFIDLTAETDQALAFCRRVKGRTEKLRCYEAIGEQLAALRASRADRVPPCQQAESEEYERACLFGARVTRERPEGL